VCGAIEVMWLIEVTPGARRSRSSQDGSSRVGHPRFRSTCYTLRSVPTDAEYFRFVETSRCFLTFAQGNLSLARVIQFSSDTKTGETDVHAETRPTKVRPYNARVIHVCRECMPASAATGGSAWHLYLYGTRC